jgi:hypothetical protein
MEQRRGMRNLQLGGKRKKLIQSLLDFEARRKQFWMTIINENSIGELTINITCFAKHIEPEPRAGHSNH